MSKDTTRLQEFLVMDATGEGSLPTAVDHHYDTVTGYELITITQTNDDGTNDVVCLSRAQIAGIISQVKGH